MILDEMAKSAYTWNGALSYVTTGFEKLGSCLDYWFKAGTYQHRKQVDVDNDMVSIFNDDPQVALAIVFGMRLVTRKPTVDNIDKIQTGYGRKDEFYKALTWLLQNRPDYVYKNLHLIPVFGCWKDLFQEPLIDLLERTKVFNLVKDNFGDHLLRKYLPTIRSKVRSPRDKKRVEFAKQLCRFLGISEKEYRKLKSTGEAHTFQQQMTRNEWDKINFNTIPGRAMFRMTKTKKKKGTVLERHGQVERLREWLLGQKVVKFTGYPYELTKAASSRNHPSLIQSITFDKQFESLIADLRGHTLGNVLCALDTSGSMQSQVVPGVSAYDICISMGLVFSNLNIGGFHNAAVEFNNVSKLIRLSGTFSERLKQIENMTTAWGGTNFQSVIDLLVRIRKETTQIPIEEYPETLLVLSDLQFNVAGDNSKTNYEVAKQKLNAVGLNGMRIIWWCLNGQTTDFPSQMNDEGVYMIGGFDPNNLKSLLGLEVTVMQQKERMEQTPLDGLKNWLSQPIFGLLNS